MTPHPHLPLTLLPQNVLSPFCLQNVLARFCLQNDVSLKKGHTHLSMCQPLSLMAPLRRGRRCVCWCECTLEGERCEDVWEWSVVQVPRKVSCPSNIPAQFSSSAPQECFCHALCGRLSKIETLFKCFLKTFEEALELTWSFFYCSTHSQHKVSDKSTKIPFCHSAGNHHSRSSALQMGWLLQSERPHYWIEPAGFSCLILARTSFSQDQFWEAMQQK